MPLINCPDCNKEISDAAPACINCGRPNDNVSSKGETGKSCSVCGKWHEMDEYTYRNRENRSYCTKCDKEGSAAYSRGGKEAAQKYRERARAKNGLISGKPNANGPAETRSGSNPKKKTASLFVHIVFIGCIALFAILYFVGGKNTVKEPSHADNDKSLNISIGDETSSRISTIKKYASTVSISSLHLNNVFDGKTVITEGHAWKKGETSSGEPYLVLSDGDYEMKSYFDYSDYNYIGSLKKGKHVRIACLIQSRMFNFKAVIVGKDCMFF